MSADVGLFVMLAIMSLEVFGIILAGYSSGSKWSLFGGMREAAQMVSYEIPLALCGLIPIIIAGSLNLGEIGAMQVGPSLVGLFTFQHWFIFHDPFTFIAFFIYFTVATASCKRAPFDLAEAESELVGGFHTEYSGMRWSFFFLGEYASMFAVSGIAAVLYLGAWHTGFGPLDQWLMQARMAGADASLFSQAGALSYFANLLGMIVFVKKAAFLVFVQIWLRWTLPRLRIDQVMMTCLKYLIPISCMLLLGVIVWPFVVNMATGRSTMMSSEAVGLPIGDSLAKYAGRSGASEEGSANTVPADSESGKPADSESHEGESHKGESHKGESNAEKGHVDLNEPTDRVAAREGGLR